VSFLVDTDWIISGLGGRPAALQLLASLRSQGLAVSVVTVAEVLDGAYGTTDPAATIAAYRTFLVGFARLEVTEPIAAIFARVRAELRSQGNLIPDMDLLIAATALELNLTLVTRNERHHGRIPGLQIYRRSN
jgi:tRNA(fMet)-specific endonuclease VapC